MREYTRVQVHFDDDVITKQAFKEECDINNIVRRFHNTGELPVSQKVAQFADLTNLPSSYHEAMQIVLDSEQRFAELPSNIRKEFNNDPGQFLSSYEAVAAGEAHEIERWRSMSLLEQPAAPSKDAPPVAPADSAATGNSAPAGQDAAGAAGS